ncbi:copper-binding protein of the mitochondrial intermembrane space Cmc1 [Schizosaccharomyces osmophilus]|uniref:COX assembly mitochondrial protein n=1 Tax=Schizosaccharomyces osmophilus TaxID=2545709 RepID=A0AAE9WDM5_9SCHI|nr:copper-binding protein of the mitochondrial intermembrane space Cmc1 [Schizosaccharomyces osmophilus]WBW74426.1 copper-binding protein of the mitochondrial intermembrane space Cmc1 [Schizosaccharomyces osmophilus]
MHPHLDINNQKQCADLILALKECHKHYGKIFGECNSIKYNLKGCLNQDRNEKAKVNREKALQQKTSSMERRRMMEEQEAEEIHELLLKSRNKSSSD